ncbi:MAG: redoxin domain-containing protein [Planctomycetaceae bacterium]|nr:redoxin domain-containing protein [Planctomycetaceae bacterium]MBT6156075.1 redoxin domain-containing protein [Planctomycetaceae bacterium]MBT6485266.1 redoxin domain-containing protein [Planctomycetaceae bacterium]
MLILPIAAAFIVSLCAYRLRREERPATPVASLTERSATTFSLSNSESPPTPVRLATFLGRHRIILVFFDDRLGADRDPRLLWLSRNAERIEDADIKVFGISGALPPQNRAAVKKLQEQGLAIPFELLTDPPPTEGAPEMGYLVHKEWGRYDRQTGQSLPGIFLIDRAGRVQWNESSPVPVELDDPTLERFLVGD